MITIHKFRTASKQNIRTFALPFEPQPYTFRMKYKYDSFNRIQTMTYPDGEVVKYGYNCGGLLSSISGEMVRRISDVLQPASLQGNAVQTNGTIGGGMAPVNPPIGPVEQPTVTCRYPYIDSILYNKFELRDSVVYGNGTSTHYEYDSLQRLSRLRSYAALGIKMQDVAYTYDNASNITHIANTAGTMSGLGGGYERNDTYDNLYRLTSAEGNWSNRRTTLPDTLDMSYSPNGRILSKSVHSTTLIEGVQKDVSYASAYTYNDNNQLKYTTNDAGSIQQSFSWDGSGNMLTMSIPDNTRRTSVRTFSWTEDNRLQTALDKNWFSYYQYDAGGERTFKITWTGTTQSVNARQQTYYTPANATLYASPYLVITQQGYTKHYYAESERVVSKVGKDAFAGISNAVVSDSAVAVKRLAVSDDVALPEWSTLPDSTRFAFLYTLSNQQESIAECYFYHTDHLGSASWITYTDGKPVQHLYYMPWGERLVDQRKSTYEGSLFAFSAKERDEETGLSYFGARYYSSDLSVWISVDPMSDIYPSMSPYNYCANNPVKFYDPNGERKWPVEEKYKGYKRRHENNYGASRPNGRTHKGLDINFDGGGNTDFGAPVLATHSGIVKRIRHYNDDKNGGGNRITIVSHNGRVTTKYMHLSKICDIKEGDEVKEGQKIGEMGCSGLGKEDAYTSHLHYELILDNETINPVDKNGDLIDTQQYVGYIADEVIITPSETPSIDSTSIKSQD